MTNEIILSNTDHIKITSQFASGQFTINNLAKQYEVDIQTIKDVLALKINLINTTTIPTFIIEETRLKVYHLLTVSKMGMGKVAKRFNISKDAVKKIKKEMANRDVVIPLDKPIEEVLEEQLTPPTYIITPSSITLCSDELNIVIDRDDANYEKLLLPLAIEDWDQVQDLVDISSLMQKKLIAKLGDRVTVNGDVMAIDGTPISGEIVDKIMEQLDSGEAVDKYLKFLEKSFDNPSIKDISDIYRFCSKHSIVIDENGMIEAYKSVSTDPDGKLIDSYTKKISNEVGTTVRMPREEVDHDSQQTCSYGLHVCAKSYLSSYSTYDSITVKVLVDPKNVCSVPSDYNDAKCRCCEYIVTSII